MGKCNNVNNGDLKLRRPVPPLILVLESIVKKANVRLDKLYTEIISSMMSDLWYCQYSTRRDARHETR